MEKDLKLGKTIKYINYNGDHLCFYFENEMFNVSIFKESLRIKIHFQGDFDKMLDTANELIFNHKLQICL